MRVNDKSVCVFLASHKWGLLTRIFPFDPFSFKLRSARIFGLGEGSNQHFEYFNKAPP